MTTETFTLETRKLSPKNIAKHLYLLPSGKQDLKQNIMNLGRFKMFFL